MKLKLDLHPIFNDAQKIEAELSRVIDEAVAKRASEVEIIPGKGSGALKKSVLRFLDRPDIKARYHRLEKDSDNWGRLFLHFRHERAIDTKSPAIGAPRVAFQCACCRESVQAPADLIDSATTLSKDHVIECISCGTPNRVSIWLDRSGAPHTKAELGYDS